MQTLIFEQEISGEGESGLSPVRTQKCKLEEETSWLTGPQAERLKDFCERRDYPAGAETLC